MCDGAPAAGRPVRWLPAGVPGEPPGDRPASRRRSIVQEASRQKPLLRRQACRRAYRLRLVETLHSMFPRLLRALGEPLFNEFALEFIRREPPRGWTLERLAETFPRWLAETKPDEVWADRIADLARREGAFRRGRHSFVSTPPSARRAGRPGCAFTYL